MHIQEKNDNIYQTIIYVDVDVDVDVGYCWLEWLLEIVRVDISI